MTTSDVPGRAGFDSRTIRIFISSTFRDFAVERDLLVRKVFPELRRRCRERQVELVDVDLRWGITEAEAEQGKVLPICLAEIDRARPFFMGLLGERYGWVPAAGQFDRSLLIEQPWLEEHAGGKSVTELEILHGVLNNPAMAGRAFFYFRDPAWSVTQGADYTTGSEVERAKLADLKDRIRASGFPVVEDYSSPETLADRVREDLWTLIDAAYPEADVPDPLTLERRRHEAYAASRRRLYLGGEHYFEVLDAELAAESPRPVLVRGRSGGGKSALLANWLARWSQAHPDTAMIVHHLGCGADAADPVRMAVRIMQEIALLVGEEFKPKSDPDEQLDDLATWLATASAWAGRTGRAVLLVLDGLDKLADRRHLRWFPTVVPPGVRLVASCLDGEVLEAASPKLPWRELVVEPFSTAEQARFIGEYLGRFRKQLTTEQTHMLQAHPLVANPLFLLTVLEELRVFGVHEELDQRLATLLSPPPSKQLGEEPTVDDAFEHLLARMEADYGAEPVQRVMEAIWASRAGLYTDEILAIAEVPPATWAGIVNTLDESLYESSGRINFGHDYLRKAVEDRYAITGDTRLALHRRLAEYFASREADQRVAEELPWQWRESQSRDELRKCLTDLKMFTAMYYRDEYELLGYWVWLGDEVSAAYEKVFDDFTGDSGMQGEIPWMLANFLETAGYYSDFAISLLQQVLHAEETGLGNPHPFTLVSINNLAVLCSKRGDYATAKLLYRRLIKAQKETLGPNHPDTLFGILNLLALPGFLDRQYAKKKKLHRRVLAGLSKALGPDHPLTLRSASSLANHLGNGGYHEAGKRLRRRVLKRREKTLGPNHPDTLSTVSDVATARRIEDDYAAAETLCCRALEGREKHFGPDHPITLESVSLLATILTDQGKHVAAEGMYRRALEGRERRLGHDHPDTLSSVKDLRRFLIDVHRDYASAEPLFRWAVEAHENTLGPGHPDTLSSVRELAFVLRDQGDYVAAEVLLRGVFESWEKVGGYDHAETLASAAHLEMHLRLQGNRAAADALAKREHALETKRLGIDNSEILTGITKVCFDLLRSPRRGTNVVADPPGTIENSIGMKFVPIPAGEYLMGAPEECPFGDPEREFPHKVRITKPFLFGMYPVSQWQYEMITGGNPSFFKGVDLPVEQLYWTEAQQFCTLLSALPEERAACRRYRLPTEAEWEYACRAGTTTTFNTGETLSGRQARFATTASSSPRPTSPVGLYPPNAWGLFDMHGNVWEWTSDWFSADYFRESPVDDPQGPPTGTHHTLRGGSASVGAHECRSAIRGEASAVDGPETDSGNRYPLYGDFGVRVVCEQAS